MASFVLFFSSVFFEELVLSPFLLSLVVSLISFFSISFVELTLTALSLFLFFSSFLFLSYL
jgi:hypothetical protein